MKVWAMRRAWLPKLPPPPQDYFISEWKGPHPSPVFASYLVWYRGYTPSFRVLLKAHYRDHIKEMLCAPNPLLGLLGKLK